MATKKSTRASKAPTSPESGLSTAGIYTPVSADRAEMVVEAAAEIEEGAQMLLRSLHEDFGRCSETVLRHRGLVLRFIKLAGVIHECVAQGDNLTVRQLKRDLYGVAIEGGAA